MGTFFSNLFNKPTPPPPPPPNPSSMNFTPEMKGLIEEFQKQYPEIMTAFNNLSAQEQITLSQRSEMQTKVMNEIKKVPVPTVNQFYTFMISLIKQYNIKVEPTDTQSKDLTHKFFKKYPGIFSYMKNIDGLTDDQQLEVYTTMQTFTKSYPLGTEDDMYKMIIDLFKKYNLPVPTLEQAKSGTIIEDASGNITNITNFKDYGKISMKMEPFMNKRSLIEKEYSSFSR